MDSILESIKQANPTRSRDTLIRRCWKLSEELGEVAEAYLNVTSKTNGKNKTWIDVREEIADVLIVAADIAFTPMTTYLVTVQWNGSDLCNIPIQETFFTIGLHLAKLMQATTEIEALMESKLIVNAAINLALTPLPDRDHTIEQAVTALEFEVNRKIEKWLNPRNKSITSITA